MKSLVLLLILSLSIDVQGSLRRPVEIPEESLLPAGTKGVLVTASPGRSENLLGAKSMMSLTDIASAITASVMLNSGSGVSSAAESSSSPHYLGSYTPASSVSVPTAMYVTSGKTMTLSQQEAAVGRYYGARQIPQREYNFDPAGRHNQFARPTGVASPERPWMIQGRLGAEMRSGCGAVCDQYEMVSPNFRPVSAAK